MKLIVITDLWGKKKFDWFLNYQKNLKADLLIYDSCELGNIDKTIYEEANLHQQFVSGSIDIAVDKLLEKEKNEVNVLAFSIGGTIAWKAILKGLKVNNLFVVSATRLRYEIEKPNCKIYLFYGENDIYKPKLTWFEHLGILVKEIKNKGHEVYKEATFSNMLVSIINNKE